MHSCSFCDFSTIDFYVYRAHCSVHYKDPNLYLTCFFCKRNKPLTRFRLLHTNCRLCVHLCRYKPKDKYEEYLKQINANFHAVPQAT